MTNAAEDIAKATGTNFGKDALGLIMEKYDKDGSGSFDIDEVRQIVLDIKETQGANKMLKKAIVGLFVIIGLTLIALFGVSIAAGTALKESHVTGQVMTTIGGDAVQTESARSYTALFELPSVSTDTLAKMDSITMYVDMSSAPIAGWVEATYKITGAYKKSTDVCYLSTPEGHLFTLDAVSSSGTLTMASGTVFPVSDQTPEERRNLKQAGPEARPMTHRELSANQGRKLNYYSGSLMTSGSFTMMASGGLF